jgi:hypothetical protein
VVQELLLDFGWCYRSQKQPPHCPMAVWGCLAGSGSMPWLRQAVCCCELSGGPEVSAAACPRRHVCRRLRRHCLAGKGRVLLSSRFMLRRCGGTGGPYRCCSQDSSLQPAHAWLHRCQCMLAACPAMCLAAGLHDKVGGSWVVAGVAP